MAWSLFVGNMKPEKRIAYALVVLVSIFSASCQHEPITVTDIIHIDTTGNGGGGCNIPGGLYASLITDSSATLNWAVVSGAASYDVQYKIAGSATWTAATSTGNSLPLTGLNAMTNYEFQVQTVCAEGSSGFSASANFITLAAGDTTPYIPCNPDTAYFQNDVLPIFLTNCAMPGQGCHDAGSHAEGMILDSYDNIMASGKVKPGKPNSSKIYEVITTGEPGDRMPPSPYSPLTADEINLIYTWILQGALNNYCGGGPCDTLSTTFSGTVFPIIQANCIGCHSGNVISGGVDLSDYSKVYTQVVNGKLYGSVNQVPGYVAMPLGTTLSDCDIRKINFWINDGAPNN